MIFEHHFRLRRWARRPVLHFALIGATLLVLRGSWRAETGSAGSLARAPIIIAAERVRQMQSEFQDRWGAPPTAAQLRALVNQAVEEELLYREARVLALGFQDASVRRRLLEKARALNLRPTRGDADLVQEAVALNLDDDVVIRRLLAEKMRLVLRQGAYGGPLPEAAMQDYLERNRERFTLPETVTFTQLFFSTRTRERATETAAAARVQLVSQPPSAAAQRLSDPFPLGLHLTAYTPTQLMGRFGKAFADQVLALDPGQWSGPLASPYGVHLVWVHEHLPARLPPLDAVRESVTLALAKERAAQNLERGLARLRRLYEIRIEGNAAALSG